jgi:hypothetical protein
LFYNDINSTTLYQILNSSIIRIDFLPQETEDNSVLRIRRGVRPFVCLDSGEDSVSFLGLKSDEVEVAYPESDAAGRALFTGQVVSGNFDGLCELRMRGENHGFMKNNQDVIERDSNPRYHYQYHLLSLSLSLTITTSHNHSLSLPLTIAHYTNH